MPTEFPKIDSKSPEAVAIKVFRLELMAHIRAEMGDEAVVRKPSAHAKKGAATQPAHTRAELKVLFGARRVARKLKLKQIKKDLKAKKKTAKTARAAAAKKKRTEEKGVEEGAKKPQKIQNRQEVRASTRRACACEPCATENRRLQVRFSRYRFRLRRHRNFKKVFNIESKNF